MRYDTFIEIGKESDKDVWGASVGGSFAVVQSTWATLTAAGGTENKQAAAIVAKNEVVFTIRWLPDITEDLKVRYNNDLYNIKFIAPEGRNKILHIKAERRR